MKTNLQHNGQLWREREIFILASHKMTGTFWIRTVLLAFNTKREDYGTGRDWHRDKAGMFLDGWIYKIKNF